MDDQPALEIRNLSVAYSTFRRTQEVLRGISLKVWPGQVLGILGEGGSGRSSLVNAVVGVMPRQGRVEGRVIVNGHDLPRAGAASGERAPGATIGMVVAGGRACLNPMARVGEQIAGVLDDFGHGRRESKRIAVDMLRRVGIPDAERRARAYPHELSGGMAQRVVIAMALVSQPRIMVCDEPTNGLDVTIAADVLDLIGALIDDNGAAAIIATRDPGIVAERCDRVAILHEGRIVEDRLVDDFFQAPASAYGREVLEASRALLERRFKEAS